MKANRSNLIFGLLLVLIGGYFLAVQFFPQFDLGRYLDFSWPVWVIAAGGLLLVLGLLTRTPEMAIPASIVAGIGGILWVQNTYNNWATWNYAWALIPGFVGVGILLSGLLGGRNVREAVREGGRLVIISATLFILFGAVFAGGRMRDLWPLIPIGFGVWLLLEPLLKRRSQS